VERLARAFADEATALGLTCTPVEPLNGPTASTLLRVTGDAGEAFLSGRLGTVRWIGTSPYRPMHKRRNWFVGVSQLADADDAAGLSEKDIIYQTLRASGPGGQHVNKTESAVRATHVPSGLSALSQEQRSQAANRKIARLKLHLLLEQQRAQSQAREQLERWALNQSLERGNAVRTYEGPKFRLRK
jgi:peptide chain release factor